MATISDDHRAHVAAPAGPGTPRSGRGGQGRPMTAASWWWVLPAVLLSGAFVFAATLAGSFYSLTDWTGLGTYHFIGLDNFRRIASDLDARKALQNTLFLAVGFVVLTNIGGMLFALALNRGLKSRYLLRVLVFMPVVLSPLAVSYIWKFIFQQRGPLNVLLDGMGLSGWTTAWLGDPKTAIWTVLAVMVWQNIGLTMVIYLAGLAGVPPELEEAAAVDGAGFLRRYWNIVLPSLRGTVVVASTLMLIQGLRIFDQVLAMTGGGPFGATQTLATLVYKQTFVSSQFGYGAALSLVMTVLVVGISLLQVWLLRGRED